MSERIRIYPLYLIVLTAVSAVIVYETFKLGGFISALFVFLAAVCLILWSLSRSLSYDSDELVIRSLWKSVRIKRAAIVRIVYYHSPGGRDFYRMTYRLNGREKRFRMSSFMFAGLYPFIHSLEKSGILITPSARRFLALKWSLFLLFAVEGGYSLRETLLRMLSYAANALSGIYFLYDYPEVWAGLSIFFLFAGFRLYKTIKSHDIVIFISRWFGLVVIGAVMIFLVSTRAVPDHRAEMYRLLLDAKYSLESRVYDTGKLPDDPVGYLAETVDGRTSLIKGWRRKQPEFIFERGYGNLGAITAAPGRVIILEDGGNNIYIATFLGANGIGIISENNSMFRLNSFSND